MAKIFLGAFVLLLMLVAAGCGGSNDFVSPFQGDYQGTYHATNISDDGTVTMSVDQFGNVTGTLTANGSNVVGDLNGSIQDNGDFTGNLTTGQNDYPFGGNLLFEANGNLTGPVNISVPSAPNGVEDTQFTLTQVAKRLANRRAVLPGGHKPAPNQSFGKPFKVRQTSGSSNP